MSIKTGDIARFQGELVKVLDDHVGKYDLFRIEALDEDDEPFRHIARYVGRPALEEIDPLVMIALRRKV